MTKLDHTHVNAKIYPTRQSRFNEKKFMPYKCPICRQTLREIEIVKNYYRCFYPPGGGRIFVIRTVETTVLTKLDKNGEVVRLHPVQN
jgi:DNA-directed RNA polymerase subunit RPC12/RpoP